MIDSIHTRGMGLRCHIHLPFPKMHSPAASVAVYSTVVGPMKTTLRLPHFSWIMS